LCSFGKHGYQDLNFRQIYPITLAKQLPGEKNQKPEIPLVRETDDEGRIRVNRKKTAALIV